MLVASQGETSMQDIIKELGLQTPLFAFSHCRDVVVAVSKARGMGVYGAGLDSDQQIEMDLRWIEAQLGDLPYGIDLLMPGKYHGSDSGGLAPDEALAAIPDNYHAFLDSVMQRYGVPAAEGWDVETHPENLGGQRYTAKQIEGILRLAFSFRPRLLVGALGTPAPEIIAQAHERGMLVGALAGKPKHALRHKAAGCDLVIAQSYEAGGHTGDIGGMVLIPQVVDAVAPLPVLAAGGITSGRQMAAALALGARGVWCGSVWLTTVESECSPLMRQKLIDAGTDDTVKTKTFTGKPARYLRSAWVDEWARPDAPELLPNPLHTVAIGKYLERIDTAAASGRFGPHDGPGQLVSKPVGQIVGSMNSQTSSRQVVLGMMEDCVSAIDRVQKLLELE